MSTVESPKDFADDARGWAERWGMEFAAAKKRLARWHKQGEKTVDRFLDERDNRGDDESRLNLFTSNVQTQQALLYGKVPNVDVSRRFADASDDVARVAGEMLERLLNTDIQRESDGYASALEQALEDRLLPGIGQVRCRYVAQFEEQPGTPAIVDPATGAILAPEVPPQEVKTSEDVETLYVHWRDQLWSPARTFGEVRWWAFKAAMTREELAKRFGDEVARRVPLNVKTSKGAADDADAKKSDPWSRAEVWEIWDKEHRKVDWYVEGFGEVLDSKEDPLGLSGFWPFPKPLVANTTTSGFVPKPDYALAQDLYRRIDALETRIALLEKAVRVAGVYDKTSEGVKRLLSESAQNELIPVDNWAMFAEKGGIQGAISWLPLEQIVGAISTLSDRSTRLINLVFQVTGMSDIMRGQASASATATEQAIKAKFGSVRTQRWQDEFARFASDVQRIKAEIISKHFDPATIIERSNVQHTPDAPLAEQGAALIRERFPSYRVVVRPESVSLTDYAALKQERTEVIGAVAGFIGQAMPMVQLMPQAMPYLLEVLQWMVAGLKGASQVEGVFDRAIQAAQQAAQQPKAPQGPPPPDPKLQMLQAKGQLQAAHTQRELQADIVRAQVETKAEVEKERAKKAIGLQANEAEMRQEALRGVAAVTGGGMGGMGGGMGGMP